MIEVDRGVVSSVRLRRDVDGQTCSVWEDVFEEDVEKGLKVGCASEIERWDGRSLCARGEANASGLVQEQHRGIVVPGKVVWHGGVCARLQPASAHFVKESEH